MILTSKDWVRVSIQGVTLPKALKCWAHQPHEHNHHEHHADHDQHDQRPAMDKLAALLPPNYQQIDLHHQPASLSLSGSPSMTSRWYPAR
jgi:hypothetical protein